MAILMRRTKACFSLALTPFDDKTAQCLDKSSSLKAWTRPSFPSETNCSTLQGQAILRQQSSSMCAKLNVIAKCQEFRQKKETLIQNLNAFKARNQHQLHWMKIYICLGLYPRDEFRKPEETILYNIYQPCHHSRKGERFICVQGWL